MVPAFANALYNRGIARRNQGDPDRRAIGDFDTAQACGMDTATLYHNRGVAHADLGDHQTAMEQYREAIERDDKLAGVWLSMGNSRCALGDFGGGVEAFDKALELNPRLAEAYRGRGLARRELGDEETAAADLLEYTRLTTARNDG